MILPPIQTENRSKLVGVRVTPSMYEMLNEQSEVTGIPVSQYIYKILISFLVENNERAKEKYKKNLLDDYYLRYIKNISSLAEVERLSKNKERLSKDFRIVEAREIFARCAIIRDFSEFKSYIDKNDTKINQYGSICDR